MHAAKPRTRDRAPRFYAPDYRRQLRDAGAFRNLSLSDHVVLAALCDRANASGIAWPAVETIAEQYGMGESTVRGALRRLAERGLVVVVPCAGRVNTYRLQLPALEAVAGDQVAAAPPSVPEPYPCGFPRGGARELAPIMTNDHQSDHDQQHHAGPPAHDAVASSTLPLTEEIGEEGTGGTIAKPEANGEPIALLDAELVDRVRQLGIPPAKVHRYGAERVRWVLERLDAERKRKVIGNPAGWVVQVLKDTWNEPLPVLQIGLPFAAAAEAARPPEGMHWARHREGGEVVEVLDVNDERVKLASGVVPAHHWSKWEWLSEHPTGQGTAAAPAAEHQADDGLKSAKSNAPVGEREADQGLTSAKRNRLAMLTSCAAVLHWTSSQLATRLEASGLTLEDWEAHQRQG